MTRARDIANLVDANGDIVAGALDNVAPSNDASALTTGTLPDGRFPATLPAVSGANLTGIPTPTLSSLGIDNHDQLTVASNGDVTLGGTGAITVPSGTTAQRPTSPVAGMVRYNTTTTTVEYYDGTQWSIITSVGENFSIDAVIAAGAGGTAAAEGNSGANGGSGAGGLVEATGFVASINTNYTVTVGAGGAATDKFTVGNQGSNAVFNTFTAIGGGGGPDYASDGGSGGSGGGGSESFRAGGSSTQTSPSGATGYGNAGGGAGGYQSGGGGGGGGAGSAGQAYNAGRAGGSGKANIITGTTLCAGGAGCPPNTYRNSTAGAANTGNGATGAGASGAEGSGASGGSGVIIIKYPESYTISVGAGLTSSSSTSAGFTTTTFTAGTDSISFS